MNNKKISKLINKYLKETDDNVIGVSYTHNIVGGKITNEMAISFTVIKKLPLEELKPSHIIPREIMYYGEKFITDVVQNEYILLEDCPTEFYNWQTIPPINRSMLRPLMGGVSVTNYDSMLPTVGTLGLLVVDNEDDTIVGLSNHHVLVNDAFIATERTNVGVVTNVSGNDTVQPHPSESGATGIHYIGKIKRYVPISASTTNKVDCAITTINSDTISNSESFKFAGFTGITTALPFASTAEINALPLYNRLYSAGRTSGAKGEGRMKLLYTGPTSINVAYKKQGVNQLISLTNCLVFIASAATTPSGYSCLYPIVGGDSGSALIADIGGIKKIIGLVFAGTVDINGRTTHGIACRIDNVATLLNIRAWGGEAVNYSGSIVEEIVTNGLDSRKTIISGGKIYWQVGLTNMPPTI